MRTDVAHGDGDRLARRSWTRVAAAADDLKATGPDRRAGRPVDGDGSTLSVDARRSPPRPDRLTSGRRARRTDPVSRQDDPVQSNRPNACRRRDPLVGHELTARPPRRRRRCPRPATSRRSSCTRLRRGWRSRADCRFGDAGQSSACRCGGTGHFGHVDRFGAASATARLSSRSASRRRRRRAPRRAQPPPRSGLDRATRPSSRPTGTATGSGPARRRERRRRRPLGGAAAVCRRRVRRPTAAPTVPRRRCWAMPRSPARCEADAELEAALRHERHRRARRRQRRRRSRLYSSTGAASGDLLRRRASAARHHRPSRRRGPASPSWTRSRHGRHVAATRGTARRPVGARRQRVTCRASGAAAVLRRWGSRPCRAPDPAIVAAPTDRGAGRAVTQGPGGSAVRRTRRSWV